MIKRLRTIATILLLILGMMGVIAGLLGTPANGAAPFWVPLVSASGAALFGASLAMIIEELLGTEVRDIWQYLNAKERFDSAPDYLQTVVGLWHVYYLTKERSGRVWKYVTYTFILGDNGKSLRGHFSIPDLLGKERTYSIECGLRGDSLIAIFRSANGQETDGIEIVPKITATHLEKLVGVQLLETWDGERAISLSLYSRSKLTKDGVGTVSDTASLDQMLRDTISIQRLVNLWPG